MCRVILCFLSASVIWTASAAGPAPDICVNSTVTAGGKGATASNTKQLDLFLKTLAGIPGEPARHGLQSVLPMYDFTSGQVGNCAKMEVAFSWEENSPSWHIQIYVGSKLFASGQLNVAADSQASKGVTETPEFWAVTAAPQVLDLLRASLTNEQDQIRFNKFVELGHEVRLVCAKEPQTAGNCRGVLPLAWQSKGRLAKSRFYIEAATSAGFQTFIAYGDGGCADYVNGAQKYLAVEVKIQTLDGSPPLDLGPESPLHGPWQQSSFSLYLYDENRLKNCVNLVYEQPAAQAASAADAKDQTSHP